MLRSAYTKRAASEAHIVIQQKPVTRDQAPEPNVNILSTLHEISTILKVVVMRPK